MTSTSSLAPDASDERQPLLTAYFDGACRLCRAEMEALHALDRDALIDLVDCSPDAFDDTPLRTEGVTRDAMLRTLHVRDVLGDWHRGVDAIALLYATVGARRLARLWVHPLTRPILSRLYPLVVRHRQRLSALGAHRVVPTVLSRRAIEAAPCDDGRCRVASRSFTS